MEITTQISKKIFATDGTEVQIGDLCEFVVGDKSLCGIYVGITTRSDLRFQNTVLADVHYNVRPTSIKALRIAVKSLNGCDTKA